MGSLESMGWTAKPWFQHQHWARQTFALAFAPSPGNSHAATATLAFIFTSSPQPALQNLQLFLATENDRRHSLVTNGLAYTFFLATPVLTLFPTPSMHCVLGDMQKLSASRPAHKSSMCR